ncbi:MAG: TrkA family potassium uptake protein [Thermomicrobiales bacterium]|jgi:trk system potassium uptake protein TrkA|nr:MAG: TrkA family potassium uptake protein [Thermomicrobiales bacterium]
MKHSVLVIGLGRFGSAAALELMSLGHEVLVIDKDESRVNDVAPDVTHAIQLDALDENALKAVGAGDFQFAIVAISGSNEASIFATMSLKNLGVPYVIAKAATLLHGTILERVGADRVVFPEREMGTDIAHTFSIRNVIDYIDVAPGFGVVKIKPPASFVGKTLRELDLANRFKLTPVALRRGDEVTVNPHRDDRVAAGDELILIGLDANLEELDA